MQAEKAWPDSREKVDLGCLWEAITSLQRFEIAQERSPDNSRRSTP
jgi:hypothetical protein